MQTLADPAILFFVFGVLAGLMRSNLEIPPAISRFLSLYLLMALGLKGGFALSASGLTAEVAWSLACAVLLGLWGSQAVALSLGRVVVNTVFGIYGIFDVATYLKLERHPEDFGQTLGYWGVPNGPYLVLPLLGPSTLRDGASLPVDFAVSPTQYINDIPTRNQVFALRLVSKRAELLKSGNMLEEASIDKYSFSRDAFLQYRRSQIYDGNPPDEEDSNDDPSANPAPAK